MNGIELITAERQRQISSERWNDDHDDEHEDGALAMAAVCYAACEPVYIQILLSGGGVYFKDPWPWDCDFDKRPMAEDGERVYDLAADVRIRQLVKAGALIAAEIDRLQRASMKASRDKHMGKFMKPSHTYAAQIVRVVDADTLVIDIDLGFRIWAHGVKVRLARVNAPEMNTDEGRAARQFVAQWLTDHPAIVVRTIKDRSGADKADSFGRYLAEVYPAGDDPAQRLAEGLALSLSDLLLAAGHAKEYKS